MRGFDCNLKITIKFSYEKFYLTKKLVNNTHTQYNNFPVLTVYRATIYKECSKYPPRKSIHTSTHLIVDCRAVLQVTGRFGMV